MKWYYRIKAWFILRHKYKHRIERLKEALELHKAWIEELLRRNQLKDLTWGEQMELLDQTMRACRYHRRIAGLCSRWGVFPHVDHQGS
jgi:hypothetical protein